MDLGLVAGVTGLIAAGIGLYVMLYAMDFFQYLGGKKRPIILPLTKRELIDSHCQLQEKLLPLKNPLQEGVRPGLRAQTVDIAKAKKGLRLQIRRKRDSGAHHPDSRRQWLGAGSSHRKETHHLQESHTMTQILPSTTLSIGDRGQSLMIDIVSVLSRGSIA